MSTPSDSCGGISDDHLEKITLGLANQRWVAIPDFLDTGICADLVHIIARRRELGAFHRAGIGRGESFRLDDGVRSDTVCWLDSERQDLAEAERLVLNKIELLRAGLNRALYLGLRDFEGHLTFYPIGGHYSRHLDRFSANGARVVSLVIYLNREWFQADGGLLRIYAPGIQDALVTEVLPEAGTLVMFMSGEVPHEVTISARERYSVTGWYRNALAAPF